MVDQLVTLALPYRDRRRVDKAVVLVDARVWAAFGHWHWEVLIDRDSGEASYVVCGIDSRRPRYLHREAYLFEHGSIEDGKVVDHINNVRTDCRLANLRPATHSENSCNRRKPVKRKGGAPTSQYKGVWRKRPRVLKSGRVREESKPWVCEVAVKGRGQKHTSTHATEAAAARRYNEVAAEWMGEFAKLNVVRDDDDDDASSTASAQSACSSTSSAASP